ncbi:MAG: hypothetical protein Tsb002_24250 [Wenzhouxiangellaceae bacterium]
MTSIRTISSTITFLHQFCHGLMLAALLTLSVSPTHAYLSDPPPNTSDLAVALSTVDTTVSTADNISLTTRVINKGPQSAINAVVLIHFHPTLRLTALIAPDTAVCQAYTNRIECQLDHLASHGLAQIESRFRPTLTGLYTINTLLESPNPDPAPDNNTDALTITVSADAARINDLSLRLIGTHNLIIGDVHHYVFEIVNHGPEPAGDAWLNIEVPPEFERNLATDSGHCEVVDLTRHSCHWSSLAVDEAQQITLSMLTDDPGQYRLIGHLTTSGNDPVPDNNGIQHDLQVNPPPEPDQALTLHLDAQPRPVNRGGVLRYQIAIQNTGAATLSTTGLWSFLDSGLQLLSVQADGDGQCVVDFIDVYCAWSALPAGQSRRVFIEVQIDADAPNTQIDNQVEVYADGPCPVNAAPCVSQTLSVAVE